MSTLTNTIEINKLKKRVEELEAAIKELLAKRGPGRPKKYPEAANA